jgi:putative chitinase
MNYQLLKGHIPDNRYEQLPEIISKFECNTPLRMAHFLSQCHHESLGFTKTVENLNYAAERLLVIFPKYFTSQAKLAIEPNKKLAADYHRQPEKIANIVYANRMGNGDTASGDGWKYRGRGDLQTTGKNNYLAFGAFAGIDAINHPDLLAGNTVLSPLPIFLKATVCGRFATRVAHLT